MEKIGDIVAVVGKYEDKNEGKEKNIYKNVGSLLQHTKSTMEYVITLDRAFNPAGLHCSATSKDGKSIWLSVYKPKEDENKSYSEKKPESKAPETKADQEDIDDEIPF